MNDARDLPLAGVRVLDYAQYVAGPFATMLLADLGADVIKVEPPAGDAWRRYEPVTPDGGAWFFALNRNKRSVVLDLKTEDGRRASRALITDADVVVHNMPPERATRFGLDRDSVQQANPTAVWSCVSAFGTDGPDAEMIGYDLIAQAASGLLLADVRGGDAVPRRSGGIAMADLTAGLLTVIGVLAGLADRRRDGHGGARGVEVSLLGASLAVQVQRFVAAAEAQDESAAIGNEMIAPARLAELATEIDTVDELEPYYRCYRAADGFLALACLNERQRLDIADLLGIADPFADNPQRRPADAAERAFRAALPERFATVFATETVAHWLEALRARNVPCGVVRSLDQLHDTPQAIANGLVRTVDQPGVGRLSVLGSVFKIDGTTTLSARPAPALGQHNDEVLGAILAQAAPSATNEGEVR